MGLYNWRDAPARAANRAWEPIKVNWHLGFTAFGGPPVHFKIFHDKFVHKLKWIDEQLYQELFSISQALSGPASTKMLYCINLIHDGVFGAVLAFFIWSLPGAIGMYALSIGVSSIQSTLPRAVYALLSGLNAATVGVIALAAVELSDRAVTDRLTRLLVALSGAAGLLYNALWYFPVLMFACGCATVVHDLRWLHPAARAVRGWFRLRRRGRGSGARAAVEEEGAGVSGTGFQEGVAPSAAGDGGSGGRGDRRAALGNATGVPATDRGLPVTQPSPVARRGVHVPGTADTNYRPAPSLPQKHATSGPPTPTATAATATTAAETANGGEEEAEEEGPRLIPQEYRLGISRRAGLALIAAFFITFVATLVVRGVVPSRPLLFNLFANLYLAGTIIFGGGPVVIPLLREYVVAEGWVQPRDFLIGLAIAQAFPGPNFNFAVFLGGLTAVSSSPSSSSWPSSSQQAAGAVVAFLAIFSPGIVLVHGTMGVWPSLRGRPWVRSAVRGVNAGAVGLIFTAVYRIWQVGYIDEGFQSGRSLGDDPWWVVVTTTAYVGGRYFGVAAPLAILLGAVLGLVRYGVVSGRGL